MRLLSLLLLLMIAPVWSAPDCEQPLRVGFNHWPPYAWQESDGVSRGLDVDILRLLATEVGCELDFQLLPAKRSHQLLRQGALDLMMGASFTAERAQYGHFSLAYREEEVALFELDSASQLESIHSWQQLLDLGYRLLLPSSGWYGNEFERLRNQLSNRQQLIASPDAERSIQMLAHGRGEVVIGDSLALPYIARQVEGVRLERQPLVPSREPIHLLFARSSVSPQLVAQFDGAISHTRKDGRLQKLQQSWLDKISGMVAQDEVRR
ncbi:substrate-binding periplasmic protein [Shewanella sedimentimangrovi]|uniref:Transporter substrate-binding domain-containing protein n=1 Tax=Shewanella sedimentimangrovi TaxID=2814293 RepID=A0ABX7QXG9_9GAMM|nr:transporter substrate-binding domain-containing protein [Shewanella sedimentimangrovi]QSX36211.1 transporter substrate-binding domain-containing protein [Shewanella sedimentimangrovi]